MRLRADPAQVVGAGTIKLETLKPHPGCRPRSRILHCVDNRSGPPCCRTRVVEGHVFQRCEGLAIAHVVPAEPKSNMGLWGASEKAGSAKPVLESTYHTCSTSEEPVRVRVVDQPGRHEQLPEGFLKNYAGSPLTL